MPYTIVHHVEKCTGCEECVKACAEGHAGLSNCRILKVGNKFAYFSCLQCKKPQCAAACPVGALVRKGEVVAFYQKECVGCKNCMEACPWGVPRFNFMLGQSESATSVGRELLKVKNHSAFQPARTLLWN